MPAKRYRVSLSVEEQQELKGLVSRGRTAAYKQTHARIMLLSDENQECGAMKDEEIARVLRVGDATAGRVRRRCVEEGVEAALGRREQVNRRPRKLDTLEEADEAAGYKVRVPTYIPAGFEFDSEFQVADHPLKAQAKSVFQSWSRASDGAFFLVEQSPTLQGLIEQGEQSTVRGITGEIVLYAADAERPFGMAALYWAEEDRGILVLGSLKSGIEESEIKSVAESIQVRR